MASLDLPRRRVIEKQLNERILLKRYKDNELHVLRQDIAIATNYGDLHVAKTCREPEEGFDYEIMAVLIDSVGEEVFDITIYFLYDNDNRMVITEIAVDYA